jgi:hypothetical protein
MRKLFFEVNCTLHIDVQQRNFLLLLDFGDARLCGTIKIAVYICCLDEFIIRFHLLEGFFGHEVVMHAINFLLSGVAGRVRDTKGKHAGEDSLKSRD